MEGPSARFQLKPDMYGVARCFLAILLVEACLQRGLAEQPPPNSLNATRSIFVNVIDSHGNAVTDLAKENFAVFLNGKPIAVNAARYSLAPRRIVVLLDLSASMEESRTTGKWRIAEEAVRALLQQAPSDVPIAMVAFGREVHKIFDFPQGRRAILNWLQENPDRPPKLNEEGTALFDAIIEGVKLLGDCRPGDALYAITDGGENASHVLAQQTEHVLLQWGVRLFAFLFADSVGPGEQSGERAFAWMVRDSGGLAFALEPDELFEEEYPYNKASREKVKTYTTELNTQIHGYWALELAAPASSKTIKVKLVVTDLTGKARKDIVVTYTRLLLPSNR